MPANAPFQASYYQVGKVVHALSSDNDGNLIFADNPNPLGVTLTQLIEGLMGGKIKFDSTGSFFTNVSTVSEALRYLNQFAYLKDTGRFIIVDNTILDNQISTGEIYNSLNDAINWINTQPLNGYNIFNIILMGSHKQQGTTELVSDIGVYQITDTNFTPIKLNKNGIKILGVGNPVIRVNSFIGTSSQRKHIFEIDSDGVKNNISINIENVAFEFVNSSYTSMFWVKNAPINNIVKDRSGFTLTNTSVSFVGGSNSKNRLVDIRSDTTQLISNIILSNIKIGSISNTIPSIDDIELIYVNHHPQTTVNLKNWTFALAEQPNPTDTTDQTNVTSFTGIAVDSGNIVADSLTLDEKFYWNGGLFSTVKTLLLKAYGESTVTMTNIGIVRHSFNTIYENAGGITTIKDWIELSHTVRVNIDGFDSYLNVDVITPNPSGVGTSGTSGVGTSGTSGIGTSGTSGMPMDVKPVKTFWNKDKVAFGIGHKGEMRVGLLNNADIASFTNYTTNYGIPFWYNADQKIFQYWNGTQIVAVGSGTGGNGKTFIADINAPQFSPTSYTFSGESTFLGFEYTLSHNMALSNKNAYSITIVERVSGRKIEPQEIISLDINRMKIILANPENIVVTLIGF